MNPVAFKVYGIDVRWYGIFIASAMLVGTILAIKESRRVNFDENYILDIILYSVPVAIVGARLYYVIFEWGYYKNNLAEVFAIRNGGLAIHGGVIGAVIAALIYTSIKHINFLRAADICAPSIILGQSIGRWGNFVNQEAYGGPVSKGFISIFPEFIQRQMYIDGAYYHPTFLYESSWDLLVFFVLIALRKRNKIRGSLFFIYIALYSLGRFFVEGLRTDSLMLGNIRVAQLMSIILILVSIITVYILKKKKSKDL